MDARVHLVFRGEVHPGHQLDDVKRRLGQALKLDEARVGQLFSGARMVLKRSLQAHEAQRYVDQLARLGARIDVEPMAAPAPVPAPLALAPAKAPLEEQIVC